MMLPEVLHKAKWDTLSYYLKFERIALAVIMLMISTIAVYAIIIACAKIVGDMLIGESFLDQAALKDTFGLLLTIVILLEFNHSIYVAMTKHLGALQARMLVLITVLVIARKLMLMDFTGIEAQTLFGFGALLLALGGLYWLISNVDRFRSTISAEDREAGATKS